MSCLDADFHDAAATISVDPDKCVVCAEGHSVVVTCAEVVLVG